MKTLFESFVDSYYNDYGTGYYNEYLVKDGESDQKLIYVNIIGHNPSDVKIDATEDSLSIISEIDTEKNPFSKQISLKFKLGQEYNGHDATAEINNGILLIKLSKQTKNKKVIPIKF